MRPWILSVVIGFVVLAAIEIVLRLASPPMPFEILEYHPVLGYHLAADRQLDAVTGLFSPEPCDSSESRHTITTGAGGERVVPASRPDQPYTLAVIGDSCTFGWDVSDDETFANRLAELARAEDVGVTVQLHAVPGYSSLEGYIQYQLRDAPAPDVAVLAFGANDEDPVAGTPWRGGLTDYELHGFSDGSPDNVPGFVRRRMLVGDLRLAILVLLARQAVVGEQEIPDGDVTRRMTPEQTNETLTTWVELLRSQGVTVITHNLCSSSRAGEVRAVASTQGVAFVDTHAVLMEQWRGHLTAAEVAQLEQQVEEQLGSSCLTAHPEMLVTTDDFHPNRHGNRIVGDVLWPHVRRAIAIREAATEPGVQ